MANSKPVYFDYLPGEQPETMPVYWQQKEGDVKFNTPYNIDQSIPVGEVNNLPSLTIPNETYTIRELLEKHTRGVMPDIAMEGTYGEEEPDFDSPDLNQIHQMDLYDVQEHLTKTKKLIEQLDENYKSQQHKASQQLAEKNESEAKVKQGNVENEQK